ncbi:MAG TPA: Spy/CpxP family protein refolding chaperone [Polyangiaceae bacterium]|nr:Spy/CpxP family protein refolding chaperone [Polyangiaceae bacterium]
MTTKSARARGLVAPLALLLSMPVACMRGGAAPPSVVSLPGDVTAAPPTSAPAGAPTADTSAPRVAPADALLDAAQGLELSETQREKVLVLRDRLARYEENARTSLRALREDIADQVRAGAIQLASVQAAVDRAAGAQTVRVDEGAETMNALYGVLSQQQRAAAVAAVRAMQPGDVGEPSARATRPLTPARLNRLARLTSDLALDRDQARRVSALLVDHPPAAPVLQEPPERGVAAILDGFAGDRFDAWTIVPPPLAPPAEEFRRSVDGEVGFLVNLVPILRPHQRDVLASIIEGGEVSVKTAAP